MCLHLYVYIYMYNNFWYFISITFHMHEYYCDIHFLLVFHSVLQFLDLPLYIQLVSSLTHLPTNTFLVWIISKLPHYTSNAMVNIFVHFPLKTWVFEAGVLSLGFRVHEYWFTLTLATMFTNFITKICTAPVVQFVIPKPWGKFNV